jgi:DNA-binding CsgD family transcriptional regulator
MTGFLNGLTRGDGAAMDADLDSAARLSADLRQPFAQWWTSLHQALRALLAGRFSECEQMAREALVIGQRLESESVERAFLWQMFALRREQGRLAEVEADVLGATVDGGWRIELGPRSGVAILHWELGRTAEARGAFEELMAHDLGALLRGAGLVFLTLLAELCAALSDRRHAARLYDLLLPYADQVCKVPPVHCASPGAVARYLGLLAATRSRWPEAEQHFAQALATHTRMGARPLLAHTAREYAAMLLACGRHDDRPRARELLELALAHYTDLGMAQHAARTHALSARLGMTAADPTAATYPGGLSSREVEVLRLVAAGRTNREIAETLVLSQNTVAFHLKSIFNKTGVANRTEAAAYAHRHHLVASPA